MICRFYRAYTKSTLDGNNEIGLDSSLVIQPFMVMQLKLLKITGLSGQFGTFMVQAETDENDTTELLREAEWMEAEQSGSEN